MQLVDGRPIYAATDLVGFLACRHLLGLERAAMAKLVRKPIRNDPMIDRVAKRGLAHEQRYLEDLEAQGLRVVRIEKDGSAVAPLAGQGASTDVPRDTRAELETAQAQTIEAMRSGADVVYQATFFDGTWRGHADFLLKRAHEPGEPDSAFGPWHYEVADTKLARHVKASAILQVCSYVEQLTRIQGRQPEFLYIVLGGSARPTDRQRVEDYMAYYRRVKAEFEATVGLHGEVVVPAAYPPLGTYPEPVEHCDVCRWAVDCKTRRRKDDDVSLVAGASGKLRRELKARDVPTRRGLAGLPLPLDPPLAGVGKEAFARTREQARIQVESDDADTVLYELLPIQRDPEGVPVPLRGFLGLPEPSPGDLFLDLEGDPFALDDGVDYLFGILEPAVPEDGAWAEPGESGVPKFHEIWSIDDAGKVTPAAERAAFERTIDLILDRWARDPNLHVYHYAAYERTAFGRLAQRYGTREAEVDDMLRAGLLVDLYRVVRQGLRAGVESYSIKKIEPLYGLVREQDLKDAGSSIVMFETWLEEEGETPVEDTDRILREIAAYNRDDVLSNWRLRDWLEARRPELEAMEGETLPRPGREGEPASPELKEQERRVAELAAALSEGVSDDPAERARDPDGAARWLLAQLLGWHRREDKAAWWRFFDLLKMTNEQLIEEREPLAGLELVGEPREEKNALVYTFTFPAQDTKVDVGSDVTDPATRKGTGSVASIDVIGRTMELKRGKASWDRPLPAALVPNSVISTAGLSASLLRTGEHVLAYGLDALASAEPGAPDLRAARSLLLAESPGLEPGAPLVLGSETPLHAAVRLAPGLEGRLLPIQGPPGSGKTFTGARIVIELAMAGRRIGVVANSHKVIGNLLRRIDEESRKAYAKGEIPRLVKIGQRPKDGAEPAYPGALPLAGKDDVIRALRDGAVDVVGAVAWTWCHADMASPEPILDLLVVDEAGQMSLANVLASAPAARSIVLLGDPQQLDQPTQGSHPPGAERSALGHILGDRATIEPHQGLFLEQTWRLHPDLCEFTSDAFYEGRLRPIAGLERQVVVGRDGRRALGGALAGAGVRYVPVDHLGNDTDSVEEAVAVVGLARTLLDSGPRWTDREGHVRPVTLDDIVIVAPYNAQVDAIEEAFARAGLGKPFVGTVDKFQGQERPISIYSMASSTPEDAPRGMEFLYSLNRLNVATSRAQCVAAVVASPELVRVSCATPRQMRLANGLCLAIEAAEREAGPARS